MLSFHSALSVLHQTLRRKGLGLEGSELDSEESMQVAVDKYPLSEGMDLSLARQRFYVSPRAHHTQARLCTHTHRVDLKLMFNAEFFLCNVY